MLYITPIKSSSINSTLSKSIINDTKVNIVDSSYGTKNVRLVNKSGRVVIQSNTDCFVRWDGVLQPTGLNVARNKERMHVIARKRCLETKDLENKYHLHGTETIQYKYQ